MFDLEPVSKINEQLKLPEADAFILKSELISSFSSILCSQKICEVNGRLKKHFDFRKTLTTIQKF